MHHTPLSVKVIGVLGFIFHVFAFIAGEIFLFFRILGFFLVFVAGWRHAIPGVRVACMCDAG